MFFILLLTVFVLQGSTAPPEIQLLINRVVDEDQSVNETIKINASNDLIVMESLDIIEANYTSNGNHTIEREEEHPQPRVAVRTARSEPAASMDDAGRLVVHLPKDKNSSTEILVGEGNNTVNQINGDLEVNSQGGW